MGMNYLLKMALKWIIENGLPYIVAWLESLIDMYFPMNRRSSKNRYFKKKLYNLVDELLTEAAENKGKKGHRAHALVALKLKKIND